MAITRDDTVLTPELIDHYTAAGHWSDRTLVDLFRRNAEQRPDHIAFLDARSSVTWGALWQIGGEVAAGLAHRGVESGHVVAIALPNRLEFVYVLVGVARLGAVICNAPPDYRAREMEFMLRFSEAHTVVVPDRLRGFDYVEMIDRIRSRLPDLATAVVVPMQGFPPVQQRSGWSTLDEVRVRPATTADPLPDPLPDRPRAANEVMRIAFTSGTTAEPKAVMHTANTTLCSLARANEEWGIGDDAVILVLLPVGLNVGFSAIVHTALAGARAVLMDRFRAAEALDLVAQHGVTTFLAAPTALLAMMRVEDIVDRDLSSLRLVQTGGQATPVQLIRQAHERLGVPVVDVYGMLETGLTSCTSPLEPLEEWAGTVGRPFPWMQVRIIDDRDTEVPAGVEGEIVLTGPSLLVGYYRNPVKNAESWTADGWFRTGDRGRVDAAGRLTISGRSKDMIVHGGANIWPRELEEVLAGHPGVAEVAVIGIHDDYFGENACACIVPRPGAAPTLDDLIGSMKDDVATYKLPQRCELFEAFPLGPTGKVLKRALAVEVERRRSVAEHAPAAGEGMDR